MSGAPSVASLERLATPGLELAELTALVAALERQRFGNERVVKYGVSGNVTLDLLEPYLKRQALLDGHRAEMVAGNFDDHLGNVRRFSEERVDVAVLVSLFDALLPALEARVPRLEEHEVTSLAEKVRGELRLVLGEARTLSRVYLCTYHRLAAPAATGIHARLDAVLAAFNEIVAQEAAGHPNVRLLALDEVVREIGWERCFSARFYHRYRAPYTGAFLEAMARQISLAGRAAGSHYYKALVLDADNTLWGGIVGEDGPGKLKLGPHDYPGSIYWQAQQEFLSLRARGVLLCLASKNNPEDVEAVLASHPQMVLRSEHFAARQVNWDDKVTNLRKVAAALGIGLDALVFLDDSPFECNAVRGQLPGVRTFQVPERIQEYPAVIHQLKELFLAGGISAESAAKAEQYRVRAEAEAERSRFATQEEYLASLGIRVEVRLGDRGSVPRIAELTQKSNQFNLTTRRYSEGQILELMSGGDAEVYSVHVSDRFGDSGLTGVVILRYGPDEVVVDSFLLSCRVIGRGVEYAIWPPLAARAAGRGARRLRAQYLPTAKNEQVHDFYDRLGLAPVAADAGGRHYELPLEKAKFPAAPHIEVTSAF